MPAVPPTADEAAAIVTRIQAGDPESERVVVDLFRRRVFVMMLARIHDRDAAEELAQDAMLAVITALRKGQLREPAALAGFVHGIGRNLANGFIRSRQQSPGTVELTAGLEVTVPPDDFERAQEVAMVRREIAGLEPTDRHILWRTLVGGEKPGEIARALGVSSEVVRTRKSRAIRRIVERIHAAGVTRSSRGSHLVREGHG